MKRPVDRKKKQGPKPASEAAMDTLCSSAAKQVAQFYRRWSKVARRHRGPQSSRPAKAENC